MSQKSSGKSWVIRILILVAAVGFAFLLVAKRQTLYETWQVLLGANIWLVLLLPIVQIINYFFVGEYYRRMFGLFGATMSRGRAWGVVSAMNFVNQVLPSGGLSGITYLAYGFRASIDAGKTTLIQLGRYIYALFSYSTLAPIALLIIILQGQTHEFEGVLSRASDNSTAMAVLGAFLALVLGGFVALINQDLSHKVGRLLQRVITFVKQKVFRREKPAELEFIRNMHREFRDGIGFLRSNGKKAFPPFLYMLSSAVCELIIVNIALLAVNVHVSVGVVFAAFIAANIVGVISVIPGDVGVHEATVLIVLTAFGVDEASVLSAILLYRVFNKMIFLPVGFYFYTNFLKPAATKAKKAQRA